MTNMKRRTLLKGTLAAGAVGMAIGTGLLTPRTVLAAWPKDAFDAKSVDDAVNGLFGSTQLEGNDKIQIKVPDIAENGAVVPIGAATSMAGVKHLALLVEKNPSALVAVFDINPAVEASFSTRAKMGQSSDVYAVAVMADG